jgi:hypothetical protein
MVDIEMYRDAWVKGWEYAICTRDSGRPVSEGLALSASVLIPMKVVSDSDLNPVTGSEVKPIVFGAKRRWRSYRA